MSTTINLEPTWEAATRIYIAVLENPDADEDAKQPAREELLRLARHIDKLKAETK